MADEQPPGAMAIRRGLTATAHGRVIDHDADPAHGIFIEVIVEGKDNRDTSVTLVFTWEELEKIVALCQEVKAFWVETVGRKG